MKEEQSIEVRDFSCSRYRENRFLRTIADQLKRGKGNTQRKREIEKAQALSAARKRTQEIQDLQLDEVSLIYSILLQYL